MRTVCPATVAEPLRASPEFESTRIVIVALPLCDVPGGCNHPVDELAVHEQPADPVCTWTDSAPPFAPIEVAVGVTVYRQTAGSCEIVNCVPFTATVPRRATGSAFAATR
jgi:hypothetical protein